MDLQADFQVRTGLEGILQPSSLVSFPLQAETSTEERVVSYIYIYGRNLGVCTGNLHPWIYK